MNAIPLASPRSDDAPAPPFYEAPRGLRGWLLTRDHKRLALLYLFGLLAVLAAGAIAALVMRGDLATPDSELGGPIYHRLFSSHAVLMLFVFAIPVLQATLGNFCVPLMIGARSLAFPRLGLAAFYLWATGAALATAALTVGSLATGWTFDTPYAHELSDGAAETLAALGVALIAASSLLTGLGLVVSIHKLRAPGVTWRRLPLFATSLYASALVQIVATPLLLLATLLLLLEKVSGIGIFDPQLGGDPVLFQHFFWAGLHPMLIAALLAALGVAAEVVSVHIQRGVSRRAFVWAIAVLAIASFFQWGEHTMVAGQSELATTFFSLTALLGVVPLLVLVLAVVWALRGSSVRLTTPLLFGLGVMCTVALGALARIPLVATSTGFHLQDSAFSVGQLHASLGGGLTLALMAGLFHWFPKMTGRTYDERLGRLAALASVLGVCLMAISELLLGLGGVPRRGASYLAEHQGLELLAGVGGGLLVLGLVAALGVLVHGLRVGQRATANPWGGASLEWSTTSPPPPRNFVATPHVSAGPYAFGDFGVRCPPIEGRSMVREV